MKTYARIEGDKVVEIIAPLVGTDKKEIAIEKRFHPDFVATLAEVPAGMPVGAGWSHAGGVFAEPATIAGPTLDELKAGKNAEINAARLVANQTTFEHAGKSIACDKLSRGDIDAVANHISLFGTFPPEFPGGWKAIDNSIIPMPNIDAFKAFYQSMTAQGTANFNHAQALKAQLYAAGTDTLAKVDAITW